MKKSIKLIMFFLSLVFIVSFFYNISYAKTAYQYVTSADGEFGGKSVGGVKTAAENVMGTIIGVTRIIAAGIAVIMIVVLAIKYMMASPEGKADIRKTSTVYIIGAVVLFASSGILSLINKVAQQIK